MDSILTCHPFFTLIPWGARVVYPPYGNITIHLSDPKNCFRLFYISQNPDPFIFYPHANEWLIFHKKLQYQCKWPRKLWIRH
jgi:hypothetical protein